MPTYNRRRFVHRAILYFQHQNYPNKELIILDDGTDAIKDLVPYDGRIRYFRLKEKVTLGAKLNMACECARGQIIAHWDDDDWYASRRLNYQVETLIREGTEICGINNLLYYDIRRICAYRYIYPKDQHAWLLGSTLCYKKIYWAGNRFAEIDVGMDGLFVRAAQPHHITNLDDSTFSVFMIHQHNVSPKKTTGAWWHAYPVEEIRKLLNSDWEFYRDENGITLSDSRPVVSIKRHPAEKAAKPVRNIFACLVHESQECVIDLVRNLRYHDHSSLILLYNGGEDENLLNLQFPFLGSICKLGTGTE
jgi:glycosyltransferase involved in cell wall biosynthesis